MSRFQASYPCLNGPKEGQWIDAPGTMEPGSSCAVAWANVEGILKYAVYTLVEHEVEGQTFSGLMFIQSHETPERAQNHVHRLTTVIQAARHATQQTS